MPVKMSPKSVENKHSKSGKSSGDGYFGQQKMAEKVHKSRQNKNCDNSA